jgi:hypothetical protein
VKVRNILCSNVLLDCWFEDWQIFTGMKDLYYQKSSFLKLLGKVDSRDRKISECERTVTLIIFTFYSFYYYTSVE